LFPSTVAAPLVFSGGARAEPGVELSGGAGFGVLAVGIISGRFAISPSARGNEAADWGAGRGTST